MSVSTKPTRNLLDSICDARQPSVDGLHSPSSPNAPTIVPKQGVCLNVNREEGGPHPSPVDKDIHVHVIMHNNA